MKITCRYCGNLFDDINEKCPHCSAPSEGVARKKVSNQPLTIEELKQWYSDRNLPPYETTRFFIGINYRKPRAFGIYRDNNTGNIIVYKNKDTGERAIRYEGTDEAYAVNELYQRLKQEIIHQKSLNLKKNPGKSGNVSIKSYTGKTKKHPDGFLGVLAGVISGMLKYALVYIGGTLIVFLVVAIGILLFDDEPASGYYIYADNAYYYSLEDYGYDGRNWFVFNKLTNEWEGPVFSSEAPVDLKIKKTAKKYRKGYSWSEALGCTDFNDSVYAKDIRSGLKPDIGNYELNGNRYYHLTGYYDERWYRLENGEWSPAEYYTLPYEIQHTSYANDLFTTQCADPAFEDTIYFADYLYEDSVTTGYYSYDDKYYYHLHNDYYTGWYYYSDSWEPVSVYELPEDLQHPSMAEDFYYTPVWHDHTQISDFEDTGYYSDYVESQKSWDSGSDSSSSYDWSSDYSWDSGSSDWSSDW